MTMTRSSRRRRLPATNCASALLLSIATATSALALCPDQPPLQIELQDGEVPLNKADFEARLLGQRVRYSDGAEANYRTDGSYGYRAGNTFFEAREARFYDGGARCIGYDGAQRFDFYVERAGTLYLVNDRGTRFPARIVP